MVLVQSPASTYMCIHGCRLSPVTCLLLRLRFLQQPCHLLPCGCTICFAHLITSLLSFFFFFFALHTLHCTTRCSGHMTPSPPPPLRSSQQCDPAHPVTNEIQITEAYFFFLTTAWWGRWLALTRPTATGPPINRAPFFLCSVLTRTRFLSAIPSLPPCAHAAGDSV